MKIGGRTRTRAARRRRHQSWRSTRRERSFYCQRGCTYSNMEEYWWEHLYDCPYYKRLREFLDQAGMSGPILWTELVKCESADGAISLSVQTVRDSIDRYLVREIACVPEYWPLIGVGAKAFEILAYRFPRRLVIGLPHPTGARGGQFCSLMPAGIIDARAKTQLDALFNGGKPIASPCQCIGNDCSFAKRSRLCPHLTNIHENKDFFEQYRAECEACNGGRPVYIPQPDAANGVQGLAVMYINERPGRIGPGESNKIFFENDDPTANWFKELFGMTGLDRREIFLTNACIYYPQDPAYRDARLSAKEIGRCAMTLEDQIRFIQPPLIVPLEILH